MMPHRYAARVRACDPVVRSGYLHKILATGLEADGPNVPLGTLCEIDGTDGTVVTAEVVRIDRHGVALMPFSSVSRLAGGARVRALSGDARLPVGDAFLGRAVDALGRAIDGAADPIALEFAPYNAPLPGPMQRVTGDAPLVTGIRAIDGLLTLGRGQRVGIFAASGVGKTSLINQLARQVDADMCVVCLVGERGREVEGMWSRELSGDARARTCLVAATSDQTAALRVRAVYQAIAIARHWRDKGKHVLLILDSVTRLAMALRETGLASGEPPTVRAYTPNVFAAIPQIVEQCGALASGGAISAIFTVLAETDDVDDPVSELMKSLLDGHIILARELAEQGHFPAIDVPRSISRNSAAVAEARHRSAAVKAHALLATHEASRTLIDSGLYVGGSNPKIDAAIAAKDALDQFLKQGQDENIRFEESVAGISRITGAAHVQA